MRDAEQTGYDGKGKDGLMGYLARPGMDRPAAPQWPNAHEKGRNANYSFAWPSACVHAKLLDLARLRRFGAHAAVELNARPRVV
jgi:hypothetical protein